MNRQNETYDDKRPQKRNRCWVIAAGLSYFFYVLLSWLVYGGLLGNLHVHQLRWGDRIFSLLLNIPLLPFIVLIVCSIAMLAISNNLASVPDEGLDGRQRMARDRAYRYAYRIVTTVFSLSLWYMTFGRSLGLPIPSGFNSIFLFASVILLIGIVPTAIIVWNE